MRTVAAWTPSRAAACLAWMTGLGFGVPAVYGTVHFTRHGEVWHFLGLPAYGEGPFQDIGVPTTVPLLAGFVAVCAAEVVIGVLMWRRRSSGLWLSFALLPIETAYWLGFALPFGPLLGAARTVAVVVAVRTARSAASA